jgi:hypothetical protein
MPLAQVVHSILERFMQTLNFDQLIEKKNGRGRQVFILCLGEEHAYLNDETHWIHNSTYGVSVVRLTESEFNVLDMGRHPKIWVLEDGEEKLQINGIPTYTEFLSRLKGIK